MLVLSLLFVSLVVLLVFCLTKDKGSNTRYARKVSDKQFTKRNDISEHHAQIESSSVFE